MAMDPSGIRILADVARAGGFAPVARTRGVAPSTLTRAVAALERQVGARLLQRTTRRVALAAAGADFLDRALPALDALDAAREAAAGDAEPSGALRVGASTAYGQAVIAPALPAFRARHPGVTVELVLSDARADLIAERLDLAVRHGAMADSGLIARRLAAVRYVVVGSPSYLAASAPVAAPEDLSAHDLLGFDLPAFRAGWTFEGAEETITVPVSPVIAATGALTLRACALSGAGLALLPNWAVAEDVARGTLVRVLPGWTVRGAEADPRAALWLVMPSRAFVPARARAFAEHLTSLQSA